MKTVCKRQLTFGNLVLLAVIAAATAWFLLLRPTVLGGTASYVAVTGRSMEPTLKEGDLAVVRKSDSYGVQDVVAFHPPQHEGRSNAVVIHRIVAGSAEEGFVTKGDNNSGRDPWWLSEDEIVGEVWFAVPRAGRLLGALRAPVLLAGLAGSVAVSVVLSGPEGGKSKRTLRENPQSGGRRVSVLWRRLKRVILSLLPTVVLPATIALLFGGEASAALPVSGGTLQVFQLSVQFDPVAAMVDVKADTLNVQSEGQFVTAYVELPPPHDVASIDVSSVVLSVPGAPGGVAAQAAPVAIGDEDSDGIGDLMVKFDRAAVVALIGEKEGDVTMRVSGLLSGGMAFQGDDIVHVIHGVTPTPAAVPPAETPAPTPPPSPTAAPTETPAAPTATPGSTLAPEESPAPTASPTASSEPTATPTPTAERRQSPAPTATPLPTFTTEPTATPAETVEATATPEAEGEATPTPEG